MDTISLQNVNTIGTFWEPLDIDTSTQGQSNNRRGELHEGRRIRDKTQIGKDIIITKSKQASLKVTRAGDCFTT